MGGAAMRRRFYVPFVAVLLLMVAAVSPVAAQEGGTILQDPVITSAVVDRTGQHVTVTGTVECEEPGEAFLDIFLRQDVGRFNSIQGSGGTLIECTEAGEVVPFTATVQSFEVRFAPGRARAFMAGFGECDEFGCFFEEFGEQNIR